MGKLPLWMAWWVAVAVACGGPQEQGGEGSTCFRDDECGYGLVCAAVGGAERTCTSDVSALIEQYAPAIPEAGGASAGGSAPAAGGPSAGTSGGGQPTTAGAPATGGQGTTAGAPGAGGQGSSAGGTTAADAGASPAAGGVGG